MLIKMANYKSALKIGLTDYLDRRASEEGVTREDLRLRIEIVPIGVNAVSFFNRPKKIAIRRFDDEACGVSAVVELEEKHVGLLGHILSYFEIRGIGIRG